MPSARRVKTIAKAIQEVRELKERAAVYDVLVNFLKTRYLPRDSIREVPKIVCDGAPVSEDMIEEVCTFLLSEIKDLKATCDTYMSEEIQ